MKKDAKAPSMKKIPSEVTVKDTSTKVEKNGTVDRKIDPRPSFRINADLLPQIKDWSAGKKYPLEIEVEMTGSRIEDWGEDKGKLVGEFKICGIMADTDADDKGGKESEISKSLKAEKEKYK